MGQLLEISPGGQVSALSRIGRDPRAGKEISQALGQLSLSAEASANPPRNGGLPPWRLRAIERRVRADGPLPSLEELAGLCRISVRHLSRAFRSETGQTVGKFIEQVMAERAHAMLLEGVAVGTVARRLGYARAGNFAQAFRRTTGLLPTAVVGRSRD